MSLRPCRRINWPRLDLILILHPVAVAPRNQPTPFEGGPATKRERERERRRFREDSILFHPTKDDVNTDARHSNETLPLTDSTRVSCIHVPQVLGTFAESAATLAAFVLFIFFLFSFSFFLLICVECLWFGWVDFYEIVGTGREFGFPIFFGISDNFVSKRSRFRAEILKH